MLKLKILKLSKYLAIFAFFAVSQTQVFAVKNEFSFPVASQQQEEKITGKVLDAKGEEIAGANIIIMGTTKGTTTDASGNFSIITSPGTILKISFIGYATKEIRVESKKNFNVYLVEDASKLEDIVVVGYNTQKKASITGSISTISTKNIITTKNENLQNMLTGKVPGVRITQLSSEPGKFRNRFDIRGMGSPLIIIDGAPRDGLNRLDPNDIESITVLKDASAAIYGVQAANGVILITTKTGKKGTVEVNYNGTYGMQIPSQMPKSMDVFQYMDLENEKAMKKTKGVTRIIYSEADYEKYRNGTLTQTDWYDAVMQTSAPQSQHNLSFSGGSDKINYFINAGYTYQDALFKSKFDYHKYNIRANISGDLTKRLHFEIKLSGMMDKTYMFDGSAYWVIRNLWRAVPTDPIYANNNTSPYYQYAQIEGLNPVALADDKTVGYQDETSRYFQSTASLTYDIPGIDGLLLKGYFGYDYTENLNKQYVTPFKEALWDDGQQTYSKIKEMNTPRKVKRSMNSRPSSLGNIALKYHKTFNEFNNINSSILYEESVRSMDNFNAMRELPIAIDQLLVGNVLNQSAGMNGNDLWKYTKKSWVGQFDYDYKGKYLTSFAFRYDGSSRFPSNSRWGFFPTASLGWRVSEEGFFKSISALSFVNNFKIRGSYGQLGDDGSSSYQFLTGYDFPSDGYVFNGVYVSAVSPKGLPNKNITWFVAKTKDVGFDLSLWKGLLGYSFDVFRRDREGLLTSRLGSFPAEVGASMPQENINSDRTQGFDMELTHNNRIGKINYFVKANMSYTRSKRIYVERAKDRSSYQNWTNNSNNRYNDIWWGNESAGRFQNYDQILGFKDYAVGSNLVPGDYIFKDWNGDGEISDLDKHPIGYGTGGGSEIPRINYGITVGLDYMGIDLNMLFQGAAMTNVYYPEQLSQAGWGANGANAVAQFTDRWRPVNITDDPFSPDTKWIPGYFEHVGNNVDKNTDVSIQNGSYIRLKSIELGYTLPNQLVKKINCKDLRFFVNGYNLLTLTGIKYLDPEHPGDGENYGYLYPLVKTINVGVNLKF